MTTRKKPTEKSAHASVSRSAKPPAAVDSRAGSVAKGGSVGSVASASASSKKPTAPVAEAPKPNVAPISIAPEPAEEPAAASATASTETLPAVAAILADPSAPSLVGQEAERLSDSRPNVANQAALIIGGVFAVRPELVVPHVGKLAKAIVTKNKKVVQVCADAMPAIAKVAPARVARELDFLRTNFRTSLEEGQDGLVRTFATLCIASVAYQKRLEPILTEALSIADGKTLLRWTQAILPSLKGEPHARARAVVEGRLEALPRPLAQPIADFLGIKLRAVQQRR